jgi:hypothetical protein
MLVYAELSKQETRRMQLLGMGSSKRKLAEALPFGGARTMASGCACMTPGTTAQRAAANNSFKPKPLRGAA